jgi:23S rRNA (uridine2552-2'-O)-methyltransferase
MHLVELAFAAAQEYLKEKGDFVCKMFQGQGADEYIKLIRRHFGKVSVFKPKSSRPDSREVYLIAKRYLG